mgnify:CR=1 FL=1
MGPNFVLNYFCPIFSTLFQNYTRKKSESNRLILFYLRNLEFGEHSSLYLVIDEIVFKSTLKFQNLKITTFPLLIIPIKQLRFLRSSN